jgi:hypothetical protein
MINTTQPQPAQTNNPKHTTLVVNLTNRTSHKKFYIIINTKNAKQQAIGGL